MTPTLTLSQLEYGHQSPLFTPLDLRCQPGEVWAILGANGRGKSTLLDTLTGVLPALSGTVAISGGVGIVPQSFRTAFAWRVKEVVLMGRARHIALFAQPQEEDERQVLEALTQLNICTLADSLFSNLSGGQQQLVMIARALVSASQNILLDEPCSALDLGNQQTVLQLISDLSHTQSRTVLFTTHDPTHALQVASHTLLLMPGGQWLAGPTAEVVQEENLQRAYGVQVRKLQLDDYPAPVIAPLFTLRRSPV
ncbi:MAG: ABC transporter ATP-binding protein [Kluyvera sp.]|uniref:ABC transporter ATP-binding protein n=1 Tax=Kluyvera sp. TaxID=1538228 RepID=UPI003A86CDB2